MRACQSPFYQVFQQTTPHTIVNIIQRIGKHVLMLQHGALWILRYEMHIENLRFLWTVAEQVDWMKFAGFIDTSSPFIPFRPLCSIRILVSFRFPDWTQDLTLHELNAAITDREIVRFERRLHRGRSLLVLLEVREMIGIHGTLERRRLRAILLTFQ